VLWSSSVEAGISISFLEGSSWANLEIHTTGCLVGAGRVDRVWGLKYICDLWQQPPKEAMTAAFYHRKTCERRVDAAPLSPPAESEGERR
jgi:hypothetical protein